MVEDFDDSFSLCCITHLELVNHPLAPYMQNSWIIGHVRACTSSAHGMNLAKERLVQCFVRFPDGDEAFLLCSRSERWIEDKTLDRS